MMGWAAANDRANGSNGPDRPVSVSPPAVVTGAPAAINGLPRSEVEQPMTDGAAALDGANGLDRSAHMTPPAVVAGAPAAINGLSRPEVEQPKAALRRGGGGRGGGAGGGNVFTGLRRRLQPGVGDLA